MNNTLKGMIVMVLAVLTAGILITGCSTLTGGSSLKDPAGRFSFKASAGLEEVAAEGDFYHYRLIDPMMEAFIAAYEAPAEDEAVTGIMRKAGTDPEKVRLDGTTSMGNWILKRYSIPGSSSWTAIAYQYRRNTAYALYVTGGSDTSPESLPKPVMQLLTSFTFTEAAGEIYRPADIPQLEAFIRKTAEAKGGSISVAVVKNGKTVYRYASGTAAYKTPADTDTAYQWGSITKLATATAVMQLAEDGRVGLDTTMDTFFPEYPAGSRITVRNLLTHSSGLPDRGVRHLIGYPGHPLPALHDVLASYLREAGEPVFEPGSNYSYNNWNFLVLGVMVEKLTGRPLTEYVRENILIPAGMSRTVYSSRNLRAGEQEAVPILSKAALPDFLSMMEEQGLDPEELVAEQMDQFACLPAIDILPAWGGLKGPAEEAAMFGWVFLNGGKAEGGSILGKKSIGSIFKMQRSTSGKPLGTGLAWMLSMTPLGPAAGHPGGGPGIESVLRIYPKKKLSVAVMGNMNGYQSGRILEYTAELISAGK